MANLYRSRLSPRGTILGLIPFFCATLAHAQLDPKCSDPNATGQFTCTIDQPNVTQHETVMPNVVFVAGDQVVVGAGGCVQTGGSGATWKLYVNPSGPNSDHLYHGLIRIPTATPGTDLVRIQSVIGQTLTVAGGLPQSQLVLHLGYEDDGYSDNGYWGHDDGTEDQCKNVGPAEVRIVIGRGVKIGTGNPGNFAFNVKWSGTGPGGLPLNPQWAWQQRPENIGAIPDTSLCHNFGKTVVTTGPNGPVPIKVPDFADCTDQTNLSNVDLPDGFNSVVCSFGDSNTFSGHVNWFPITVEGQAAWGDHGVDDDYTFEFRRDGNPLSVNGRPGLHTEFDSDETIDNFNSDEWKAFHQAVDARKAAQVELANCNRALCTDAQRQLLQKQIDLPGTLFDGQTILTGMFGLDCEHDCKGELHPLYALANRRDVANDPAEESWLMFVRNVGDEGYCSHQLWPAPFSNYTFRLPWRSGMTGVQVLWGNGKTQFEGTSGTSGPTVTYIPLGVNHGVYVSFTLPAPSQSPLIDGALHLKWSTTGSQVLLGSASRTAGPGVIKAVGGTQITGISIGPSAASEDIDEAENKISAAIDQLPAAQRTQVQNARATAVVRPALHALPAGAAARQISTPPTSAGVAVRLNAAGGVATTKQNKDAAEIRALCAATNNAPAGLPATICKSAVIAPPVRGGPVRTVP